MSSGKDFIEFLKRVKYPEANQLDPVSFDWMFDVEELKPFLESLCSLGEENLLTPELAEFIALHGESDNEQFDIDALEKIGSFCLENDNEEDVKEEIDDLKTEIHETEKYVEVLVAQKDQLKLQEMNLHQQIEKQELLCTLHEKEFKKLKDEEYPHILSKFIDKIDEIAGLISKLDTALKQTSESCHKSAKSFIHLDMKPYLKVEEDLINHIKLYLENMSKEVNDSILKPNKDVDNLDPQFSPEELQDKYKLEALHLKKSMQTTEENYVRALAEELKAEHSAKLYKELLEKNNFDVFNLTELQFNENMKKTKEDIEALKSEEKRLLEEEAPKIIKEYYQAEFDRAILNCYKEKIEQYKLLLEKIKMPLDELISQRARLELLNVAMNIEEKDLEGIKSEVISVIDYLVKNQEEFEKRKSEYECKLKDQPSDDKSDTLEESVLDSINKVLDNSPDKNLLYLTANDVLEKLKKLCETDKQLKEESESLLHEQMNWIRDAGKSLSMLQEHLHGERWQGKDHPLILAHELSVKLKNFGMQVKEMEEKLFEVMTDFDKKKKILEKNANMREARKLFIYALTDCEKFSKSIEKIKKLAESHQDAAKYRKC